MNPDVYERLPDDLTRRFEALHQSLNAIVKVISYKMRNGVEPSKITYKLLGLNSPGLWTQVRYLEQISTREPKGNRTTTQTITASIIDAIRLSSLPTSVSTRDVRVAVQSRWDEKEVERVALSNDLALWRAATFDLSQPEPFELTPTFPLVSPAMTPVTAAFRGRGWRRLADADFTPPVQGAEEVIRDFLRGEGRPPLWTARHGSVPRPEVADLLRIVDANDAVIIHGPVGQGASTLARQLVARWVGDGKAAFLVGPNGLQDPALEEAALAAGRSLLLLDGVRLTEMAPTWCSSVYERPVTIVQTVQSRHRDEQRKLLPGNVLYELRSPVDHSPYVALLIKYDASAERDPIKVSDRFAKGLRGGLWTAMWETTRGEALDDRIGRIADEFFTDERNDEAHALAAITFLNAALLYSHQDPAYSRLTLDPRRSTLSRVLVNHPDLSPEMAQTAVNALRRFGRLLLGEFVRSPLGEFMDDELDPVIEFRSAGVTHAFNRWIFGALKGRGNPRQSRWRWYEGFLALLRQDNASLEAHDHIGLLRSLGDAWKVSSNLAQSRDHYRSQADLPGLAKAIYDIAMTTALSPADRSRLDFQLSRTLDIAATWLSDRGDADSSKAAELHRWSNERLLAATVTGAPSDVLLSAADRLSRRGGATPDQPEVHFSALIDRILQSSAPEGAKAGARALRFGWYCLRDRTMSFAELLDMAQKVDPERLRDHRRLIDVVHGFLKKSCPATPQAEHDAFYRSMPDRHPLGSMVGTYCLAIEALSTNTSLRTHLAKVTSSLGPPPHQTSNNLISALSFIVQCASDARVPLAEALGERSAAVLAEAAVETQNKNYHRLPAFLNDAHTALALNY